MSDQSIIIKFKSTGSEALTRAIKNLTKAERELRGEKAKLRKQSGLLDTNFKRNNKSAGALANAFSTMRSKMLLLNFAMGLGVGQLVRFGENAARIENMSRAFNTLSGGSDNASIALDKLKEATDGTMTSFDLFQQANNAMILGVTRNSDEMAEMFDMAQRLGRALGRDTASSVESLITGIGRQSRLMLDNIGIIVKSDEAYKSYANQIGKSVSSLSDAEKKQAFFNATLESAREKIQTLPDEVRSTQESFNRLSTAVSNATIKIGNFINPVLVKLADGISNLLEPTQEINEELNENIITNERNAIVLDLLKNAFNTVSTATIDFVDNTSALRTELKQNIKDSEELGETYVSLVEGIDFAGESFEEFDSLIGDMGESTDFTAEEFNNLKDQIQNLHKELFIENLQILTSLNLMNQLSSSLSTSARQNDNLRESFTRLGRTAISVLTDIIAKILVYKTVSKGLSLFGGAFGLPSAIQFTLGSFLGFPAHTGGLIKDNKVQKFATGGVVEGQDNVPILAQNGEFVMSRNAVESVGIETMNRINQTGSTGVTVNVSGNVMSQDFVEGELAERIKEAVRKGSNFGMS